VTRNVSHEIHVEHIFFVELALLRKTNARFIFSITGGKANSQQQEKPFHCNVCDGTFSRYSSLWSHKRLHSGDKPFKCEVCGLAFAKGKDRPAIAMMIDFSILYKIYVCFYFLITFLSIDTSHIFHKVLTIFCNELF
jgi:hypothetical protein